jgi:hypothetical protein
MNRYNILLAGGLLMVAIVFGVVALRRSNTTTPVVPPAESVRDSVAGVAKPADANPVRVQGSAGSAATHQHVARARPSTEAEVAPVTGENTPREQAVTAWEQEIDDVIASTNVPVKEYARPVKEAFDKLDKADQLDCIHHCLNLLPDEQFAVLYDILYDKTEDPEVLDAIFSDALNRPEAIKNPLMKDLRKDSTHPMFFESARILDVTGSAESRTSAPSLK